MDRRIFSQNGNENENYFRRDSQFNDQIYSDVKMTQQTQNNFNKSNVTSNVLSEKRSGLQSRDENKFETNIEEERDFCIVCYEDLYQGEIINYCMCSKFYHPNCLIHHLNRNCNQKSCEDCLTQYQFANYKQPNQMDSTMEKTLDNNISLIDTNINNLDNYNEMCGMAFHMSHEGIAELINKRNENSVLTSSEKEMGRIALSPITLTTTPYSGKTKGQISSNQKVEDYIRLQNTHTTPSNCRHVAQLDNENETSPEISFQGIRQHLSFYSPNQNLNQNNFNNFNQSTFKNTNENNTNFDIDKFFKSINFDLSSAQGHTTDMTNLTSTNNLTNQISFRKIVFDDFDQEEKEKEIMNEFEEFDKENSPPLPRESSKYSYIDPELIKSLSPIEVNIEAGLSHIVSDHQKIVEIPITVDIKIKENFDLSQLSNFSKDYIIIFNTINFNIENVFNIFKILSEKMKENDRVFANVFKMGKWLNLEDLRNLIYSENFPEFLFEEMVHLNYIEISKLVIYCIDLSFEHHSNIFSLILVNDIDEIPVDVDYLEAIQTISNKFKDTKVNLIKNFTINCIVLDHCKLEEGKTQENLKSISFFYDLSLLSMGYFFAPKDLHELYKSVQIVSSLIDQSSILNVKANIKGNKDPSVFIEVMNYPNMKRLHNTFDVYLGSLMKKEKKILNLMAIIILNNQNVSMNLPLLEVNLEFMSLKQIGGYNNNINNNNFKNSTNFSFNNFNNNFNNFNMNNLSNSSNGSGNLIKNKTPYYQISIPIINRNKEVITSNSIILRNCCAKIADLIKESLDNIKNQNYDEALNKLYQSKHIYEQTLANQTGLIKYFKLFSDINNSSINLNMNNVHFLNLTKINNNSTINNTLVSNNSISNDDSLGEMMRNINSANISKIFSFCWLILNDINNLIEMIKNSNFNLISDFFTIQQSLTYYRPVHLNDERFLDDVID